jgi:O-antigen ligase
MVKAAKLLLAMLIVSLAFMKPSVRLAGFDLVATDLLFPPLLLAAAAAFLTGRLRVRWNPSYWPIAVYLAALALSAAASPAPLHSALKLATVAYLALLAVAADQLVESNADLRFCLRAWCVASAAIGLVLLVALAAFLFDPLGAVAEATRFHFGTLPPGAYPRFALTFYNANMLCAYLTVSLGMLLVAAKRGWIGRRTTWLLLAALIPASLLTISPGLGGIAPLLGLWLWAARRETAPLFALFVAAAAVTPILHPTAPFLIEVPGATLAPSGRLLAWIDATHRLAAHPLLGGGIGTAAVDVHYRDPSGYLQTLTDAHNNYLNIAAQAGLIGLAGLIAIVVLVVRRTFPLPLRPDAADAARVGLGLTFLAAFGYEGLTGSFEDARFLWVLLGLFLAACRIAAPADEAPGRP